MARYLLAASPIPGHVGPLLAIGADLARRGHSVDFLTGEEYRGQIDAHSLHALGLPRAAHPRRNCPVRTGRRLAPLVERYRRGRRELDAVFIDPMAEQYWALRQNLSGARFDALLCDVAFTGALALLLDGMARPPVLVCGVGPLTLSSVDTPPFGVGWHPRRRINYRSMTWVVHRGLFRDTQARLDRSLGALGSRSSPVFLTDWPVLADRVLQLTVPGTEYPRRDLARSVTFTGPVIAAARSSPALPRWWRQAVSSGRRIVHVTQGTWDNTDLDALIGPTMDALAARDDVIVIAATGRAGDATVPFPVPGNAYVTDLLPYHDVLPHVDVMITNGGYGGVHHALIHGTPLVVAGSTADKPEVAARVAYVGAGIDLATARPTAAAIGRAVDRVLRVGTYRDAAEALARDLSSYNAFDRIADALISAAA